ncbi:photosystem II protein [Canna indica]|uniref:Photosystem II protein n=1 Tax=Canna indica TaxID=4628 RepID=A0AAQ3Q1L7_9LILI|nr:photosystem II protein [Canna indica]
MLVKAGKEYLSVLSFLGIWVTLKQQRRKVQRWSLIKEQSMSHQIEDTTVRLLFKRLYQLLLTDGKYVDVSSRGNFYLTWEPGQAFWQPHNRTVACRIQNMGWRADGGLLASCAGWTLSVKAQG